MTKKKRSHNDEAWANAKRLCRLTRRQVGMARALGMNPRKLPGLRPGPQQHWKRPVGEFIEECYRKRFGADSRERDRPGGEPVAWAPSAVTLHDDLFLQTSSLVCYFTNLANDLEQWLAHGEIDTEVLPQVCGELRAIATALETGAPVLQMPEIPVAPRQRRTESTPVSRGETFDDEDIPF
jgi:hypothetical protein